MAAFRAVHPDAAHRNATIRSAATVMLVRDRPDLQVFVVRRTPRAVFGPGATVFPGGAVDPSDELPGDRIIGLDDAAASAELGLPSGGLARRVAAVRECFEEAGILLADPAAHHADDAGDADDTLAIALPDLRAWRDAINAGHATLGQVLESEDLVVDVSGLRVFAHWLTPVGAPRRYDTWFFVARSPEDQDGLHDDSELVASEWVRPMDALRRHARGDIELILPTVRSLEALARYPTVETLFAALDSVPREDVHRPLVIADAAGERVAMPGDDLTRARTWTIPLPDIDIRSEAGLAAEGVS
jgi:8-oxo-dGTP pyrophosphatase MutT (NUDIX family)